jgi:hypothetical protein
VVAVTAVYILATERVIPALRGEPVLLQQGDSLTESLEFRALGASQDEAVARVSRVPSAQPSLLLAFASTCPACYANLPAWKKLVSSASESASVLAVALERDSLAALSYSRDNLPGAIAVIPRDPQRFVDVLGLSVVPFTILVYVDGRVAFLKRGRLESASVVAATRALGALPGSSKLR